MATEQANSGIIMRAMAEAAPASGASARVQGLWTALQTALVDYRAAAVSSSSFEGSSTSLDAAAAGRLVVECYGAYRMAVEQEATVTGGDPVLNQRARGRTFRFDQVQLST